MKIIIEEENREFGNMIRAELAGCDLSLSFFAHEGAPRSFIFGFSDIESAFAFVNRLQMECHKVRDKTLKGKEEL